MSSVARGNGGERRAARFLEDCGYLVASRRHVGGAGDLLAREAPPEWLPLGEWGPACARCGGEEYRIDGYCSFECRDTQGDDLLIEVKTGWKLWQNFTRTDRADLLATAATYGCEPLLCFWPVPSVGPFWIPPDEWPSDTGAMLAMRREGKSNAEIAAAFGMPHSIVRERLRSADVTVT